MIIIKNKNTINAEDDFNTIEKLEKEIFPNNYYNVANLNNLFQSNNFYCLFYKTDNKIVAYCLYNENDKKNIEIYKIGVQKKYRNKKIGTFFLDYLKNNYQSIFLEVSNRDNTKNFYLKNGFKIITNRANYYSDNSDAIVFKWTIKKI